MLDFRFYILHFLEQLHPLCLQVHCLLWSLPIHPPLGGHHHHLHQDLLLLEEEEVSNPLPGEKTEKNKLNPDVNISHISHQVQKNCKYRFLTFLLFTSWLPFSVFCILTELMDLFDSTGEQFCQYFTR